MAKFSRDLGRDFAGTLRSPARQFNRNRWAGLSFRHA
jgi:hypothetical protein